MNAVDMNILVYAKDPRDFSKQTIAGSLVRDLDDGVLLWQVVCEFFAASRKLESFGYSLREAWKDIEDLRSVWELVLPTWNIQAHAHLLVHRFSISYWNGLLVSRLSRGKH